MLAIRPKRNTYYELADPQKRIPVYTTLDTGDLTPAYLYQNAGAGQHTFLLESGARGGREGRYSYLGLNPRKVFIVDGGQLFAFESGRMRGISDRPLAALDRILGSHTPVSIDGLPPFAGGLVGYFGYGMVESFDPNQSREGRDDTEFNPSLMDEFPDAVFFEFEDLICFDNQLNTIFLITNQPAGPDPETAYTRAEDRLREMAEKIEEARNKPKAPSLEPVGPNSGKELFSSSNFSRQDFMEAVEQAREYIVSGDIFQVVLSQRLSAEISCAPFDLYRALGVMNPSPYMFYLDLGERKLIGSSPELLVKKENSRVQTRPLAGTRPRGSSPAEDRAFEEELLADEKERAEHVMLVDLGRNDLGQIAEYGTVEVTELLGVEYYSNVMHIVSNVEGDVKEGLSPFAIIGACFPAGTVSGAPKIRAMEIIDELEPDRRGPYAGGVGYIDYRGDLDFCITIRTMYVSGRTAAVQAGAGIVYDSQPDREYQETLHKASALLASVRCAEGRRESRVCGH